MKKLKLVIFSLIPVFVLLLLLEGGARLIGPPEQEKVPAQYLQQLYDPKTIEAIRDKKIKSTQLNSHAFRSPEFSFDKKEDEFCIVVVGGSVATGGWAQEYKNVPAVYLESQLKDFIRQKYNKKLVVYSLAESGDDIEDEAFWLFKLGLHMKPDAVVSITGYNNMFNSMLYYWDFSSGGRSFQRPGVRYQVTTNPGIVLSSKQLAESFYIWLKKHSVFIQWLNFIVFPPEKEKDPQEKHLLILEKFKKPEQKPVKSAERFRAGVDNMYRLCASYQIPLIVILQPFKDAGVQEMAALPADGSKDNMNQLLYRTLAEEWKAKGEPPYPYLDASAVIGDSLKKMNAFADGCHLWDNGFILFNQHIADFVQKNLEEGQKQAVPNK